MSGMANVTYFRTLWLMSRTEFLVALVAFLGVLSFGVLPGVVIGVVLSLVILIVHIGDPPTSVLGRTSSGTWRDLERSADARPVPGVVVWRQEAPLLFLNARRLGDRVRTLADDPAVELLIADASGTTGIDTTGLTAFLTLRDELHARGVELWLVHPLLRIEEKSADGLALLGAEMPPIFDSLDEAVATFERRTDQR
jgi:MFS superfamily sulfate permease-like transporter